MTNPELEELGQQLDAANSRMLDADWSVWRELPTRSDDVTLLGA